MNKMDKERWTDFLLKANKTLASKRGLQAKVAKKLEIAAPDFNRILKNNRTPNAGLALGIFAEIEAIRGATVHYASEKLDWGTPLWLFSALNRVFRFTLDAAASDDNAKCKKYFTKQSDGLNQSWKAQRVWLNPPYGKAASLWCEKALTESRENGALVVLLLASRSSTRWWHDFVLADGNQNFSLQGRLTFEGAENCAPFSSVVVVMPPFGKPIPETEGLAKRIERARLRYKAAS